MNQSQEDLIQQIWATPHSGVVTLDMLDMSIPLFTNYPLMVDTLISQGAILDSDTTGPFSGEACIVLYDTVKGGSGVALYAHPACMPYMLVQQAVHLASHIFETFDLPTGHKGNNLRAHMCGHIFSQVEDILLPLLEELLEDEVFDQMQPTQRKEVIH
jgi:hypothetical protein